MNLSELRSRWQKAVIELGEQIEYIESDPRHLIHPIDGNAIEITKTFLEKLKDYKKGYEEILENTKDLHGA